MAARKRASSKTIETEPTDLRAEPDDLDLDPEAVDALALRDLEAEEDAAEDALIDWLDDVEREAGVATERYLRICLAFARQPQCNADRAANEATRLLARIEAFHAREVQLLARRGLDDDDDDRPDLAA